MGTGVSHKRITTGRFLFLFSSTVSRVRFPEMLSATRLRLFAVAGVRLMLPFGSRFLSGLRPHENFPQMSAHFSLEKLNNMSTLTLLP